MCASPWAPAGQFTAHNVVLPDGTHTLPGEPPLATGVVCQAALRQLREHLPNGGTVVDLGCLEGGYAAAFAQAGYDTVGVEARSENYLCAMTVLRALQLPNLHFAFADVRTYLRSLADLGEGTTFDAAFCCGLLYHLDQPVAFLKLLASETSRLLILNTHYSLTGGAENEGYEGHWYGDNLGDRWSSWGNSRSFWLTEPELVRAMLDAGWREPRRIDGAAMHDRGMWVAGR